MSKGAGVLSETPWRLEVNGAYVAAGTVRPPQLREMACGRLRADGWILSREDLLDLQVEELGDRIAIRARVPEPRAEEARAEQEHRREMGCGALHVVRCVPALVRHARAATLPDLDRFRELFRALFAAADRASPIGGVHAAALVEDATMLEAFADVSRHNTVDKAIGHALLSGRDPGRLGLIVSARVSGEMAQKAARAGIAWLASRSLATSLAIEIAKAAGMPIVARAPGDAVVHGRAGVGGTRVVNAPIGMVIAGGRSRRYGAPKALERVGGRRIVDRVIDALSHATDDVRLIANDPAIAAAIDLPSRPDILEDLGALGGIHAALTWAGETDSPGIIAVACDMPFLSSDLLRHLAERAAQPDAPDVVAPASDGPRGIEPLCAWYGTGCAGAIERALERGDRRVIGFHGDVEVVTVPIEEVATFGDPAILFMNVNTPAEREEAERIASERAG